MNDTALISVRGLTKRYRLGRPSLVGALRGLWGGGQRRGTVVALDDFSVEVRGGEAVGLVGANGSGKTTLLRILARITEPTSGEARLRGPVGALLDIAAGFHDELTGRENAQLSGAIHGFDLRPRDIEAIARMAEVERFLDTPMRRYSMGMYQRLGIATAARIDASVLLVDESFSAVDGAFRSFGLRCLLRTVERGGAMLLVSHQLDIIAEHTTRCLWLDQGRLRMDGRSADVLEAYSAHLAAVSHEGDDEQREAP